LRENDSDCGNLLNMRIELEIAAAMLFLRNDSGMLNRL